jgi:hypothetical protein
MLTCICQGIRKKSAGYDSVVMIIKSVAFCKQIIVRTCAQISNEALDLEH